MSHLKQLIYRIIFLQRILITFVFAITVSVPLLKPAGVLAAEADCSDVYTPLSAFVVNGVATNKTFYLQAMNETGVPWEMLAAIHYRETSFSHSNPGNGQGIFQFVSSYGGPYPTGPVSDSEFYRQLVLMANKVQDTYAIRNTPNPATVQLRRLTPGETDINLIKNTLYSYNGRSTQYANQGSQYGFNPAVQPYEGSPYVMNRFDCQRARMGMITVDYGTIDGQDTRYGAFTIFARLRGATYWTDLQSPFVWRNVGVKIMDEHKNAEIPTDFMNRGDRIYIEVTAQNMGPATWWQNGANPAMMGTQKPENNMTPFCDITWVACNRAGRLIEASVPPGAIGHFAFYAAVPNDYGEFRLFLKPLLRYQSWMTNDTGFNIYVRDNRQYDWAWMYFDAWSDDTKTTRVNMNNLAANQTVYVELKIRNRSANTWLNTGANPVYLGTQKPQDHLSKLCTDSWISCNRPAAMTEPVVKPGQPATFGFTIKAPSTPGEFRELFRPVVEYKGWGRADDNHIYMKVTH